jgi:hypothetical protein
MGAVQVASLFVFDRAVGFLCVVSPNKKGEAYPLLSDGAISAQSTKMKDSYTQARLHLYPGDCGRDMELLFRNSREYPPGTGL